MKVRKIIVNIDGPRGIGKTTQINMLKIFFENKGLKIVANTSIDSSKDKIEGAVKHLSNDIDIVFNEGSFLRVLAEDFVNGIPQAGVLEKNRNLIELNDLTRHTYKVINLIMVSDQIDDLHKRIAKYNKLTESNIPLPDIEKEADIVNQIVSFERSMVTLNSDTKLVYIDTRSSILDVREFLVETISAFL